MRTSYSIEECNDIQPNYEDYTPRSVSRRLWFKIHIYTWDNELAQEIDDLVSKRIDVEVSEENKQLDEEKKKEETKTTPNKKNSLLKHLFPDDMNV